MTRIRHWIKIGQYDARFENCANRPALPFVKQLAKYVSFEGDDGVMVPPNRLNCIDVEAPLELRIDNLSTDTPIFRWPHATVVYLNKHAP